LWDTYNEDKTPRADIGRIARIAVIVALGVIIFAIVSNQSVTLFMNLIEFGGLFTKPLYYSLISGLILAAIFLVRVNFASRHSMTWYSIKMLISFFKRNEYESRSKPVRYYEYKMSLLSFVLWQLTKVVLFAPLFGNVMFGMAIDYLMHSNDIGLGSVINIFAVPFAKIPMEGGGYAHQYIIPMFPTLTLIIPPLIAVIGLRIFLFVGVSGTFHIISSYMMDAREGRPRFMSYISEIEIIVGVTIFWIGFTMFFNHIIDFNTKYAISGTLGLGAIFIVYGVFDKGRARVIISPTRKHILSRLLTIGAVIIIAGATMSINASIADAKKIDWSGPHIAQEIAINRYMHDLDQVGNYTISKPQTPSPQEIQKIVNDNSDILNNIRLWDGANAKAELDSKLASRNDISSTDPNIIKFDSKMYWEESTAPKLPDDVSPSDQWFKLHLVYTHSDAGIKMIRADDGSMVDESKFFPQENIYYGESSGDSIFSRDWSAFPVGRTESAELDRSSYNGSGGANLSPPLSWMFEPTFMLSDPGSPMHIMRYKEAHNRMGFLYPYFVYQFGFGGTPANPDFRNIDVYPVTDGKNTYWLMPLIALLDSSSVPWSSSAPSSFMLRLVGYALINTYSGSVQIIVTGNDYFSNMFYYEYRDTGATRQFPGWLGDQIRYPAEMVMWKVSKFNNYHVTDPEAYIDGKNFYITPEDASKKEITSPNYLFAKPQGFEKPVFVAIQPLQFAQSKDSTSRNLAGYIVVQNDLEHLGNMTFYSLPAADSSVRFLGPDEAQNIVEKSKEYEDIKTLNENNLVIGDNILYRVGSYEVYFSALFKDTGIKKQIASVAAAGAISTPAETPQVGFGSSPAQAFENYLQKLSGGIPSSVSQQPSSITGSNQTAIIQDKVSRIQQLERVFTVAGLKIVKPTAIFTTVEFQEAVTTYKVDSGFAQAESAIHSFVEGHAPPGSRIYEWQRGTTLNFGVLEQVNGITENHYISVEVG